LAFHQELENHINSPLDVPKVMTRTSSLADFFATRVYSTHRLMQRRLMQLWVKPRWLIRHASTRIR